MFSLTSCGLVQQGDAWLCKQLCSDADTALLPSREASHQGIPNQAVGHLQEQAAAFETGSELAEAIFCIDSERQTKLTHKI